MARSTEARGAATWLPLYTGAVREYVNHQPKTGLAIGWPHVTGSGTLGGYGEFVWKGVNDPTFIRRQTYGAGRVCGGEWDMGERGT